MQFDPTIWGEHYWFFLFTVALSYPTTPNAVSKRKYYDLIQNLPLFIPDQQSSENFCKLINRYPITPYLDSRDAFVKWIHFIHNKINELLGHKQLSLLEALNKYNFHYKPKYVKLKEDIKNREKTIFMGIVLLSVIGIYYIY